MSRGRILSPSTASQIVMIATDLGEGASFRRIWLEARRRGVISRDRSLRKYLDLLVASRVLKVRKVKVGAPLPKEIYRRAGRRPLVLAGLGCLQKHGLNWEGEGELHPIGIDLEGVVRGLLHQLNGKNVLLASLEDGLLYELRLDHEKRTGSTEFVGAMLATRPVDLPYLIRRADQWRLGKAARLLLRRLLDLFSSKPDVEDIATYLAVRDKFLRIMRNYASHGVDRLIDSRATGTIALRVVKHLSEEQVLAAAGKQLGVRG